MGGAPAPQWLAAAFVRSARSVGATADADHVKSVAERLIARWCEPGRFHHGLSHLIEVLQRVDTLAEETHDPDAVRLAAWYHGAIFDTSMMTEYRRAAGEDKVASAELARVELSNIGVPDAMVDRITTMILTLRGHANACRDIDCQVLSDADLGSLAVEPQKYRAYRENVRKEFAHLDRADYVGARIALISKLLDRPHLFASPMAACWEEAARENLAAELARLKTEAQCLARASCEANGNPDDGCDADADADADAVAAVDPHPGGAPETDAGAVGDADDGALSDAHDGAMTDADDGAMSNVEAPDDSGPRTHDGASTEAGSGQAEASRSAAAVPSSLESDPAPRPRPAGMQRPAEVVGRPVITESSEPKVETATSWGIEREPSDLRSLPRRNARTIRLERRTELHVEDDETHPARPSGQRPTRPKDDDATGSLFRPLSFD